MCICICICIFIHIYIYIYTCPSYLSHWFPYPHGRRVASPTSATVFSSSSMRRSSPARPSEDSWGRAMVLPRGRRALQRGEHRWNTGGKPMETMWETIGNPGKMDKNGLFLTIESSKVGFRMEYSRYIMICLQWMGFINQLIAGGAHLVMGMEL